MDGFDEQVLKRLPLTEAMLLLFRQVLDESTLGQIFEKYRGRCYERELSFAKLVYLIRDALVQHQGSGRQSLQRAQEAHALAVTPSGAYQKLARLPLAVSQQLLAHAATRLQGLMPASATEPLPASLAGLRAVAVDGKTLKHVTRRLKGLRHLRGKLLGAKLCVAMDLVQGLALAMAASENGEANEVPLTPAVLRRCIKPPIRGRSCGSPMPSSAT